MFALLEFRAENTIFVVTTSTFSMHHNGSVSFLAALGGAEWFSAHLDTLLVYYDEQSKLHVESSEGCHFLTKKASAVC